MPDSSHHVPTAREIMRKSLITLAPDSSIFVAIRIFVKNSISGAPVVDADGKMVGMLSEVDCLRVLAAGEFYSDDHREEGTVRNYMTEVPAELERETCIRSLALCFRSRHQDLGLTPHPVRSQ